MGFMDGDYWSGLAQDEYESRLVEEARGIAAGILKQRPTVEHLRVLLSWLDGVRDDEPVRSPF